MQGYGFLLCKKAGDSMSKHKHNSKGEHSHLGAKSIDEYAYSSRLFNVNCGLKTLFSFLMIITAISSSNYYVPLFIAFICCFITTAIGRIPLKKYISLFSVPLVFIIMGAIAIAITVNVEGGFYISFNMPDVLRAVKVTAKAVGAVSGMYMLSLSTPMNEIITLLGKLRIPEILCELMRLIYRYIFILMDSQIRLKNAAAARLGYNGYTRSLKTFGMVCSNMLVTSLRRASDYYNAVESRSFGGRLKFYSGIKKLKLLHLLGFILCYFMAAGLEIICRLIEKGVIVWEILF